MNNTIELDEIVDIKYIGTDTTVDIEVDGDNLFYGNGILTHNSQMGRSALNIPINELDEGKIADSWKKIMIADGVIAMAYTAEERKNGRINMKGLKNRNGIKDFIIKLKIKYEILRISDLSKKEKEAEEYNQTDVEEEPPKKKRYKKDE